MRRWGCYFVLLLTAGCVDVGGAGGGVVGTPTATTTTADGGETSVGGSGGAGGAGGFGGVGGAGGSGGEDVCLDEGPGEPNETIAEAIELAGGTDCDVLGMAGTIDGPDDVDWYFYVQTDDVLGCDVNPGVDWAVQSGHTLLVCSYVECQVDEQSPSTVDCNAGSTPDTHDGLDGCCHTLPFDIGIGMFGCSGATDLLNVYTSVEEQDAPADTCADYNLNYTF
jgi:hypothetical protein